MKKALVVLLILLIGSSVMYGDIFGTVENPTGSFGISASSAMQNEPLIPEWVPESDTGIQIIDDIANFIGVIYDIGMVFGKLYSQGATLQMQGRMGGFANYFLVNTDYFKLGPEVGISFTYFSDNYYLLHLPFRVFSRVGTKDLYLDAFMGITTSFGETSKKTAYSFTPEAGLRFGISHGYIEFSGENALFHENIPLMDLADKPMFTPQFYRVTVGLSFPY